MENGIKKYEISQKTLKKHSFGNYLNQYTYDALYVIWALLEELNIIITYIIKKCKQFLEICRKKYFYLKFMNNKFCIHLILAFFNAIIAM